MAGRSRSGFHANLRMALGFMVLATSSCSRDSNLPLFPVEGRLFVDKKPAAGAVVWMHSVTPQGGLGFPKPHGSVDQDGRFSIGTFGDADGAPAGKYKLTVVWRGPAKVGDEDGARLISLHYMDPEKSGLPVVEVLSEPTVLPPLEIPRQK